MTCIRCNRSINHKMMIIFSNTACTVVRSTTVWTTTRSSSSVVNTLPSPAHPTLEYSTDGKKLKVISDVSQNLLQCTVPDCTCSTGGSKAARLPSQATHAVEPLWVSVSNKQFFPGQCPGLPGSGPPLTSKSGENNKQ